MSCQQVTLHVVKHMPTILLPLYIYVARPNLEHVVYWGPSIAASACLGKWGEEVRGLLSASRSGDNGNGFKSRKQRNLGVLASWHALTV